MKVLGWCLTNCMVDLGELSLHVNWDFISHRAAQLSSSVLAKEIIWNINRSGAMISPCLTPTLKSMYVSIFLMMSLTTLLPYMRFIAEHSLGGAPYFTSMDMSSAWLEVSKNLDNDANANHVGRLCLCLRLRSDFIVNVTS